MVEHGGAHHHVQMLTPFEAARGVPGEAGAHPEIVGGTHEPGVDASLRLLVLHHQQAAPGVAVAALHDHEGAADRKSTRLNSSHVAISYAVCCLKKKNR